MLDTSNYYSSTSGHMCELDHCALKTSLKLHIFGMRFYGYHYWSPVSTISNYSKIYVYAISHQHLVSSSNGWTPTLVRVA